MRITAYNSRNSSAARPGVTTAIRRYGYAPDIVPDPLRHTVRLPAKVGI